ncbi:MAG TPA: hypothetical protein VMU90_08695 [Solirubrobacteraceae bacterium]|nr:hypothetical protein [Solirubrobacteraceae bacterium]
MSAFARFKRTAAVLLVAGLASSVAASSALGDADPASDILLGAPAFYPFSPPVSNTLQNQLEQELSELQKKGLNLKVGIIQSPVDLGAIPNMFGQPQTYANFLDREISFNQPQPLLVVMPNGFGISHAGPPSALSGLKVDAAGKSDGLTRSAILAVQRIAQANAKPIAALAPGGGKSGSGGTSPLITFGAPALIVLIAVSAIAWRQRRAGALETEEDAEAPS